MKALSRAFLLVLSVALILVFFSCSGKDDGKGKKFIYEKNEDSVTITGYSGIEEEVSVPKKIEGLPVTEIAENAFNGMVNLKKITLPDTVTKIDYAFVNCADLISVDIGNGIISMNGAFKDCINLEEVVGGESAVELSEAFMNCTALREASIPSSAVNCNSTFKGCSSLTSVMISEGITSLPFTFYGCSSLMTVTVPSSVSSLLSTFEDCISLVTVNGIENVKSIESAFKNCSSLTKLTLGSSVTTLKDAFINCSSLQNITDLPTEVVEYSASFTGCSSLSEIIIPKITAENGASGYSFIDDIKGCTWLTKITVNTSFLSTAEFCRTFSGCSSLKEVILTEENAREFLRVSSTYTDSLYEGTNSSVTKAVSNCKKNNKVRVVDDYGYISGTSYTHIYGGDVDFFDHEEIASSTDVIGFEPFNKTYYWCGYPKGTNYKKQAVALQRDFSFFLRVTGKNDGSLPQSVTVNGMNCVIINE